MVRYCPHCDKLRPVEIRHRDSGIVVVCEVCGNVPLSIGRGMPAPAADKAKTGGER
jgi:hypothetical protein